MIADFDPLLDDLLLQGDRIDWLTDAEYLNQDFDNDQLPCPDGLLGLDLVLGNTTLIGQDPGGEFFLDDISLEIRQTGGQTVVTGTLTDVILRHGGEATIARDNFINLSLNEQRRLLAFLTSLQLFSPPDTASVLDPGNPGDPGFPLVAHGSIDLSVLFNDPGDKE